jgi:hypothetical protein
MDWQGEKRLKCFAPLSISDFRYFHKRKKYQAFLWMQRNKKNWQFARSLRAGRRAAAVMSVLHLARLNSHDVRAYMTSGFWDKS